MENRYPVLRCLLLRTRHNGPRSCRNTENYDELAPLHEDYALCNR
jgi:hypothetical protein